MSDVHQCINYCCNNLLHKHLSHDSSQPLQPHRILRNLLHSEIALLNMSTLGHTLVCMRLFTRGTSIDCLADYVQTVEMGLLTEGRPLEWEVSKKLVHEACQDGVVCVWCG